MNRRIIAILKVLFFLAVGITLLYFAYRNQDWNRMVESLRSARYGWVFLSMALSVLAFLSRAHRWGMLLRPMGYKPKLFNIFNAMMVGYLANFALPRLGEITRCTTLSEKEKIPFNVIFGTVISERTIDVIMLGLSLLLAAYLELDLIGGFILQKILLPIIGTAQQVANMQYFWLAVLVVLGIMLVALMLVRKRGTTEGISQIIRKQLIGFLEGIKSITRMQNKGWFLIHTFFIWITYFFMSYTVFFALDATSDLDYKAGIFTLAIGGMGMAAPVQGGIGVYHLLIQQGLTLFGIDPESGIVYATIVHTSQTLLILLLGGLSLTLLFVTPNKTTIEQNSTNRI